MNIRGKSSCSFISILILQIMFFPILLFKQQQQSLKITTCCQESVDLLCYLTVKWLWRGCCSLIAENWLSLARSSQQDDHNSLRCSLNTINSQTWLTNDGTIAMLMSVINMNKEGQRVQAFKLWPFGCKDVLCRLTSHVVNVCFWDFLSSTKRDCYEGGIFVWKSLHKM